MKTKIERRKRRCDALVDINRRKRSVAVGSVRNIEILACARSADILHVTEIGRPCADAVGKCACVCEVNRTVRRSVVIHRAVGIFAENHGCNIGTVLCIRTENKIFKGSLGRIDSRGSGYRLNIRNALGFVIVGIGLSAYLVRLAVGIADGENKRCARRRRTAADGPGICTV